MPAAPAFSREWEIPAARRLPGGAGALKLGASASADIVECVARNKPLPARTIDVASLALEADGKVKYKAGAGAVAVSLSGEARLQLSICDDAKTAAAAIGLDAAPAEFRMQPEVGRRLAVLSAGYEAEAGVQASHPIGVLGKAKFGAEAARRRTLAVVYEFPAELGAFDVFARTIAGYGLPRHVESAQELQPGMTLLAEVEGSLAVKTSAQLGYDFSFVRETEALGLSGDLGMKLDLGLQATLGFKTSGRYLVSVERPDETENVRLRLYRLAHKGWDFGLALSVRAETVTGFVPDKADDFVSAVFGVHGRQVIKELQAIEKEWLTPDLSDKVAGLARTGGLQLLRDTTGIDPKAEFQKARGVLMGAIAQWEQLPERVAAVLWSELGSLGLQGNRRALLENSLKTLAGNDKGARKSVVQGALGMVDIDNSILRRILTAAADRGLAELVDRADAVQPIAQRVLEVLNGGVIEKLQGRLLKALNLDQVLNAVTETDWNRIDGWLISRLSQFFDRKLGFAQLEEVKTTIRLVLAKRQEIYAKARKALDRRYDFNLALGYQSAAKRSALLDVSFDTREERAREMLAAAMSGDAFDRLLVEETPGVTLNNGVLTHEITSSTYVEVNLPHWNSREESFAKSLAKVAAREEGGRVLFYELDSTDTRTVRNRLTSQISLSAAIPVSLGAGVRRYEPQDAKCSYELRTVLPKLGRTEFENRLAPLLDLYFAEQFAATGTSKYVTDLDRAVEDILHNDSDEFGDVVASLDLSVPAEAVAAWLRPRGDADALEAARLVSLRIQKSLRWLLPSLYFQDLDHLGPDGATAALMVWASLPPMNDFALEGGRMRERKGVIWDVASSEHRRWMLSRPETAAALADRMRAARERLRAAGRERQAAFFVEGQARNFLAHADVRRADNVGNFYNLLTLESRVSRRVHDALKDMKRFFGSAASSPTEAIAALAEAGESLTSAFHGTLASVYGGAATRMLGSLLFVEGACALEPTLTGSRPTAVLSLTVLREQPAWEMAGWLADKDPPAEAIALEQRLVAAHA